MATIRWARAEDVVDVKRLADSNRHALGFVLQRRLHQYLERGELLVAEHDGRIVAFVSFHCRRDGWTTIHELCVEEGFRQQGIGRALVQAVQNQALRAHHQGIRLKCPVELPANGFYARIGFSRVAIESGKRRPLAVWEKRLPLPPQSRTDAPSFFITLTHSAYEIRKIIRLWDESGDSRDPFARVVLTPLFSSASALATVRRLKEERGSTIMFDSGGYQVQMGRIGYEELFERLVRFYRDNDWADLYVLPDHVPCSTDTDREVDFKVRETLDFARLFLRMMPEGFEAKAIGVVHGRTDEHVRRCVEGYAEMGVRYIGFGSFGTSGPNGSINMVSRRSMKLLRAVQEYAKELGLQLHVFGIGSPGHLMRLASTGIQPTSFDSAGWWKAGGFGKVFFPGGRQILVTRPYNRIATREGIERERERTRHNCQFCADISELRRKRMMRIMHNLTAMLETVERLVAYEETETESSHLA